MTMFTSALEKVARAQEQTAALEREIATFLAEDTYKVREHMDTQTGRKTAIFGILKEPPVIRWGVMVGEVFHNLRSALDHAVTDLTIAESGQPLEGTEFPIFENEADYNRLRSKGNGKGKPAPGSGLYKIRGVGDPAKAIIYGLQPFEIRKRKPKASAALTNIHALNIIDKHRTVHVVRARMDDGGCRLLHDVRGPVEWTIPIGEIKDGTKLAEWTPIASYDAVDMEFNFNFAIVLDDNGPDVSRLFGIRISDLCNTSVVGIRWVIGRLAGDITTPPPA